MKKLFLLFAYLLMFSGIFAQMAPANRHTGNEVKNAQHYVGELYGGGIVFYVSKDNEGIEHGLIVSPADLDSACSWSSTSAFIGPAAESTFNGKENTKAIVEKTANERSAALLCDTSTLGGYHDWYLPSIQELNILWNNWYSIKKVFYQLPGTSPLAEAAYWSSTEDDATTFAWYFGMYVGGSDGDTAGVTYKDEVFHVRAVRAF